MRLPLKNRLKPMPPITRSQKHLAAINENCTPAGPKVHAFEDVSSSQQGAPTLSIASPGSPSIPLYQRSTKRMNGPLTPLDTQVEHAEDSPASVKTHSLDISKVEHLQVHLLELKRKVQLQIGEIEEKISLESLAPTFLEKHQEYMDHVNQLVEVCRYRIGQAVESGEHQITGPIDIGSRLLSRTTTPLIRKRLDSLTEQPTAKKACLAETNHMVDETPMQSSADTQYDGQYSSWGTLTYSSRSHDSMPSSPSPDASGISLDQASLKKNTLAERYPQSESIGNRSVESDSNLQCDQPPILQSTHSNPSSISSHHSIMRTADRDVEIESSSSCSPLPLSLDIPQTKLSEERKENTLSDHYPPEKSAKEKAILNPKLASSPHGLPPSNACSSSPNAPVTPHPIEKALEPDSSSPHQDSPSSNAHSSCPNEPITPHPTEKVIDPESSSPHQDSPPSNAHSSSPNEPITPHPSEKVIDPDSSSPHQDSRASNACSSSPNVPVTPHPIEKALEPYSSSPHQDSPPSNSHSSCPNVPRTPYLGENALDPDSSSPHQHSPPSNAYSSSPNVPVTPHPTEKALDPDSSRSSPQDSTNPKLLFHPEPPLEVDTSSHIPPATTHLGEKSSIPDPSSPNVPITTHPGERASDQEASSPLEVVTKEKPLFFPESPLSIHNPPLSNQHSLSPCLTTYQAEKSDHVLPLSSAKDLDKVNHGEQHQDEQNAGKQEMEDAPLKGRHRAHLMKKGRQQTRKTAQAKKINVNSSSLDKYDIYADPILLKDVLIDTNTSRCQHQLKTLKEIDGNTRMEFGWYTKEMLKAILLFMQISYLQDPNRVHKPGTDSSGILWLDGNRWLNIQNAMANEDCLSQMLAQCPRLLQISATHPYFNSTNFKMDVLSESIDAKLGAEFRSGSWFALNQLMCRSTPLKQYHSGDFSDASRTSLRRLTQITRNAASSLESLVMPPLPKSTSNKEDLEHEGCRAALNFLFDRLSGLGAALPTNEKPPPNIWGVKMILTKIYELLLGIVLIYQGHRSKTQEIHPDCLEITFLHLKRKSTKGSYRQDESNPSFYIGHAKKLEEWRHLKQRCIGAVAIFVLFGVQGWFSCFKNRKKYNYTDIYSILTLAHDMTSREISIISPQTNPDLHTPWRHLNSFLVDLFCTTKMGLEDSNWYSAMYIWGSVLEVQTISYLVLQDVFEEFKNPGESLSSKGSTAPPTVVNPTATQNWHVIIDRVSLPAQVYYELRDVYAKETGTMPHSVIPPFPSVAFEGIDIQSKYDQLTIKDDNQEGSQDPTNIVKLKLN